MKSENPLIWDIYYDRGKPKKIYVGNNKWIDYKRVSTRIF